MAGIHDPTSIDLVTQNEQGEIALVVSHPISWDTDPSAAGRLREKLNNYASYVLDGGLVTAYPEAAGRPVRVQVDCVDQPTGDVDAVIGAARRGLERYGIRLVVSILDAPL